MANTQTIDLVKPVGTDYALISTINGNSDKIDAEAAKVRGNFAGTYSTSSAYAVGAYCIYQGDLYRCTTAIGSGGEAWNAGHWTQVSVGSALTSLNGQIGNFISKDYGTLTWATDLKTSIVNLLGSVFSDCPNNGSISFCGFFTGRGALSGTASKKNSMLEYHISALDNNFINGYYATPSSYTYNNISDQLIDNIHLDAQSTKTLPSAVSEQIGSTSKTGICFIDVFTTPYTDLPSGCDYSGCVVFAIGYYRLVFLITNANELYYAKYGYTENSIPSNRWVKA